VEGRANAVIEVPARTVIAQSHDFAHGPGVVEKNHVHLSFDDMNSFALVEMFVRTHVGAARVDDEHLVQPVGRVGVRTNPDALAGIGKRLLLERLNVCATDLHDRIAGQQHFVIEFLETHRHWLNCFQNAGSRGLGGCIETNCPRRATNAWWRLMTFSSFSAFTASRHRPMPSFTSASDGITGRCEPGMNLPCFSGWSSKANARCGRRPA